MNIYFNNLYFKLLTIFLSSLLSMNTIGQTNVEPSLLIVACKSGTLIIDGLVVGSVEADDASKHTLSMGEHYIQLKTTAEKFNLTLNVDQNTKGIIKIGCNEEVKVQGKRLVDKEVSLEGALGTAMEENVIGLDKGDEIILNCSILNKKGTATIFLKDHTNNREIFRKENFTGIINEKIKIHSKGIYYFSLYTDALFGKNAKITIDRVPSATSNVNFNSNVKTVFDTSNIEVLRTVTRVYSSTNEHGNRTAVKINLPQNTTYWTYWIGVGQESQEKMKSFTSNLSQAGSLFSANPLVMFGMRLIPSLPMLNATSTVNYQFVDSRNANAFINNQQYSYYTFKHAKNISTDYSIINQSISDIVLAMENPSTFTGQDVEIRVVAFIVKPRLILEE